VTVEVHTWEPNANSGKPLLCLHEKRVRFGLKEFRNDLQRLNARDAAT